MNTFLSSDDFVRRGYATATITAQDIELRHHRGKYTILLLCTGGSAVVEFNMERFELRAGARLCYTHVMQFSGAQVSPDFSAAVLVMNEQFAFESMVGIDTATLQTLFDTPVATIDDSRHWQLVMTLYEALRLYAEIDTGLYHDEVAHSLYRDLIIFLGGLGVGQHLELHGHHSYTMADTYFRNFINLINDHIQQQHDVAFYADKLHITSKYLNEICKHKSGHKAKEIISAILTTFLKRELIYSSKSMKEIAASFGFADQSSLGKFFRKHTGVSPLTYKHQQSLPE